MENLASKLHCVIPEDKFQEAFEKTKKDMSVPYWMEEAFLDQTHESMQCFPKYLEQLKQAQKAVRENPFLLQFAKMLAHQLRNHDDLRTACQGLTFPQAPEGEDPLGYDTVVLFPIIAHIQKAYARLLERGIDQQILQNTYRFLENSISGSINRCGRFSLLPMYLNWSFHYLQGTILRFERFNLELRKGSVMFQHILSFVNDQGQLRFLMKKPFVKGGLLFGSAGCKDENNVVTPQIIETEEYVEGHCVDPDTWRVEMHTTKLDKAVWKPFLQPEDTVINIHIPADVDLTPEGCLETYDHARKFYQKYFPERNFKAFACRSWLLSRELEQVLKPTSNILAFGRQFSGFPVTADATGVFTFAFNKAVPKLEELDIASLPEETSLHRGVKQLYQQGGYIYEYAGMFPF